MVTRYSIIDQIWLSSNLDISNACVIPLDLTDHFPVDLSFNLSFNLCSLVGLLPDVLEDL